MVCYAYTSDVVPPVTLITLWLRATDLWHSPHGNLLCSPCGVTTSTILCWCWSPLGQALHIQFVELLESLVYSLSVMPAHVTWNHLLHWAQQTPLWLRATDLWHQPRGNLMCSLSSSTCYCNSSLLSCCLSCCSRFAWVRLVVHIQLSELLESLAYSDFVNLAHCMWNHLLHSSQYIPLWLLLTAYNICHMDT